jgi:hypothetical protein
MRHLTRCAVLAALLLTLAGCQKSKGPGKSAGAVSIEQVRVGLPHGRSGKQTALSRNGVWAPVYVTLKAGKDSVPADSYRLAIQTNDAEGSLYRFTVTVPSLSPEEERVVIGYAQPGGPTSEFTPILQRPNGETALLGPKYERKQERTEILEPNDQLIFSIGAQLTNLEQTLEKEAAEKKDTNAGANPQGPAPPDTDKGRRRYAYVDDDLSLLPDQWFGYDAVDLVVLNTRQPTKFLDVQDDSGKRQRQALLEWVRRGGRIVLSVGKRHDRTVGNLLKQLPLFNLEADFEGDFQDGTADLKDVSQWAEAGQTKVARPIEIAAVKVRGGPGDPERSPRLQVLVRDANDHPLIVQTSCGLGRVLVVFFDLDAAPFVGWEAEAAFWKKVLKEMVPEVSAGPHAASFADDRKPSLGSDLQRSLEMFENIPPTSFGWVALFILFYIVLVGPLDYFILKKLFKRMELTWLTFPAVVIVVSVTAYLITYSLKGAELRINKIDIVEFDLTDSDRTGGQPRAYGRTWFTLFSPRIANFTVGLQPSVKEGEDVPGWFPPVSEADRIRPPISWSQRDLPKDAAPAYGTTIALVAAPERTTNREGETNLVPQAYEYADAAEGLERVPIPVWATRTFSASYAVPLDRNALPFQGDLRFGSDDKPQGSITNNLPVGLTNVVILYNGKWYKCADLPAQSTTSLDQLFQQRNDKDFQQLFPRISGAGQEVVNDNGGVNNPNRGFNNPRQGNRGGQPYEVQLPERDSYALIKALLFYDLTHGTEEPNSGLRNLDQSWRVQVLQNGNRSQAGDVTRRELLLVGRIRPEEGTAEELTRLPNSPTRVWLDHLPGTVAHRPALEGLLSQQAFVRVYLPIRSREPR